MSDLDPLARLLAQLDDVPRELPSTHTRPDRATVAALLAADGRPVTLTTTTVDEDLDGIPSHVHETRTTTTIAVSLGALGWTQAEWDDPTITE